MIRECLDTIYRSSTRCWWILVASEQSMVDGQGVQSLVSLGKFTGVGQGVCSFRLAKDIL